jgi:hypothetical protein
MLFKPETALQDILSWTCSIPYMRLQLLRLLLTDKISNDDKERVRKHLLELMQSVSQQEAFSVEAIKKEKECIDNFHKQLNFFKQVIPLFDKTKQQLSDRLVVQQGRVDLIDVGSLAFVKRSSGEPTLGIVVSCLKNGEYRLLVNHSGDSKTVSKANLEPISADGFNFSKQDNCLATDDQIAFVLDRMKSSYMQLEELIELLDQVKPLDFDDSDSEMEKQACPLLFMSNTTPPQNTNLRSSELHATFAKSPQQLGKDLQFLFTAPENVSLVKEYLSKKAEKTVEKMHVLSFDAAHYLLAATYVGISTSGRPHYVEYLRPFEDERRKKRKK